MRLITCDRHRIFSDALSTVLSRAGHLVAAQVCTPEDGLRLLGHDEVDAWLVEIGGPDSSPIGVLREAMPEMPLVVVTGVDDRGQLRRAVSDGADGVVLKTDDVDELLRVVVRARTNRAELTGRATWSAAAKLSTSRAASLRSVDIPGVGSLTAKELEVMARLTNGESTGAIATGMGVEISTVRTHLQHLYSKLDVHSRLELVSVGARLTCSGAVRPLAALAS